MGQAGASSEPLALQIADELGEWEVSSEMAFAFAKRLIALVRAYDGERVVQKPIEQRDHV